MKHILPAGWKDLPNGANFYNPEYPLDTLMVEVFDNLLSITGDVNYVPGRGVYQSPEIPLEVIRYVLDKYPEDK
jgi:hypothetical protein